MIFNQNYFIFTLVKLHNKLMWKVIDYTNDPLSFTTLANDDLIGRPIVDGTIGHECIEYIRGDLENLSLLHN